jgi:predicted HAD superfamily phosphohydrolase YqeG
MTIEDEVLLTKVGQEEIIVEPTFASCKTLGQTTVVTTNGCKLTVKAVTTTTGAMALFNCTKPLSIAVFKAGGVLECTVSVGSQLFTNPAVDFTAGTFNGKADVTVRHTVTGVTYTVSPSKGTVCGEASALGKITGSFTLFGYSNAEHTLATGISVA